MMEKAFNNEELGIELNSYIDKKLMVWFKAKEVAQILGYKKTRNAIEKHVSRKISKGGPELGPPWRRTKMYIYQRTRFLRISFQI